MVSSIRYYLHWWLDTLVVSRATVGKKSNKIYK